MFYPINLKIDDMKIVIIGGGKVAYRKCMNFLAFNKKVKEVILLNPFIIILNLLLIININNYTNIANLLKSIYSYFSLFLFLL